MKTLTKLALGFALLATAAFAQPLNWRATTTDVSLTGAYAATIQQQASSGGQILIDQIMVYCSVACSVSQVANAAAATATAGTVTAVLPTPIGAAPITAVSFFVASNASGGTDQAGIVHVPAGSTVVLCLSPTCGNGHQVALGAGGGTAANYSVSIASITGNANITFFGRLIQ
jgi:hypothetical protein